MRNILFGGLVGAAFMVSPGLAQQTLAQQTLAQQTLAQQTLATNPPPLPPAPPTIAVQDEDAEERKHRLERTAFVEIKNYDLLTPKPSDYPVEAWAAGHEGAVGYLLYVGSDGKPQACEITESSGFKLLDDATCSILMERGEFEPARDGNGDPVMGEFPGQYRWQKKEPEFEGTMTVHVAFTVNEDGSTSECETIEISGTISERMRRQFEREPCPGMNRINPAPYRDENGVPIKKRVRVLFDVEVEDIEE